MSDIEVEFKVTGDPVSVAKALSRSGLPAVRREAFVTVSVKIPGFRGREPYVLPGIVDGRTSAALDALDKLRHQARISVEEAKRAEHVIEQLGVLTK